MVLLMSASRPTPTQIKRCALDLILHDTSADLSIHPMIHRGPENCAALDTKQLPVLRTPEKITLAPSALSEFSTHRRYLGLAADFACRPWLGLGDFALHVEFCHCARARAALRRDQPCSMSYQWAYMYIVGGL